MAGNGFTKPEAGVIATSPATRPEMPPSTLGLPCLQPLGDHPAERRGGGAEVGGDEGAGGQSDGAPARCRR